ncbi:unnamed protein product, partial [Didymodactylos carnosus]
VDKKVLQWIRALQPVHRCAPKIFESILIHGHVMGKSYMEKLTQPKFVAHTSVQHNRVRTIIDSQFPAVQEQIKELILALVDIEFMKEKILKDDIQRKSTIVSREENALKHFLSEQNIQIIREKTIEIARDSIKLHQHQTGIGYEVDADVRTNQHVFSILGPHTGHYYGDVIIVFKPEIMLHPDTNFTIQAATFFPGGYAYKCRPWLTNPGSTPLRIEHFHSSKIHSTLDNYEYVTALELMGLAGRDRKTMNVGLQDIINYFLEVDSHQTVEVHLPQLIPLSYIDKIYVPKNVFESMNQKTQESKTKIFRNRFIVTDHEVDMNVNLGTLQGKPPDPSRSEYTSYVLKQLLDKVQERSDILLKTPNFHQGTYITVAAKQFITIPHTITQTHQHTVAVTNRQLSNNTVYLYFKVKNGDFMLILTNERMDPSQVQKNLIFLTCYISPMPSTTNLTSPNDYHETESYLNNLPPTTHAGVLQQKNHKASSNHFHKGCNTDDYVQYCLRIRYQTGQVSLIHVGVNSLYNHSTLEYKFSPQELDITKLEYIQIQTFTQTIPIENFFINFEPILELHAVIDKQFRTPIKINQEEDDDNDIPSNPPTGNKRQHKHQQQQYSNTTISAIAKSVIKTPSNVLPVDGVMRMTKNKPSIIQRFWNRLFDPKTTTLPLLPVLPTPIAPVQQVPQEQNQYVQQQQLPATQIQQQNPAQSTQHIPQPLPQPVMVVQQPIRENPPCKYSNNCRFQYTHPKADEHCQQYSHPCRYSELCRQRNNLQHCTHSIHYEHKVPTCPQDQQCQQKHNSLHRYEHRHTDFSDLLFPCKDGTQCQQKNSVEHSIKYSHGENIQLSTRNVSHSNSFKSQEDF